MGTRCVFAAALECRWRAHWFTHFRRQNNLGGRFFPHPHIQTMESKEGDCAGDVKLVVLLWHDDSMAEPFADAVVAALHALGYSVARPEVSTPGFVEACVQLCSEPMTRKSLQDCLQVTKQEEEELMLQADEDGLLHVLCDTNDPFLAAALLRNNPSAVGCYVCDALGKDFDRLCARNPALRALTHTAVEGDWTNEEHVEQLRILARRWCAGWVSSAGAAEGLL